nr:T9SS type A sorting domain-containing protein [Bacteroidota bacterium]
MIPKIQHSKDKPPAGVGGVLLPQCPLIGGSAVYLARPIVEMFDDNIMYNDAAICLSQGVIMKMSNQVTADETIATVKVYPNPAKDEINFEFGNGTYFKLIIYDSFGKEIRLELMQSKIEYKLSTTDIANGIYRYKLIGVPHEISGKIVILK